jgi:hypothetical protein
MTAVRRPPSAAQQWGRNRLPKDGVFREHPLLGAAAPCPEREELYQYLPEGARSGLKVCCTCGRVTARRDSAGLPRCSGEFVVGATCTDPLPRGARIISNGGNQ